MIRLLVTARDVAAALHLIEVVHAARADPRFEVEVAAQEPAATHVLGAGIRARRIDLPAAKTIASPEATELLQAAARLLAETRPDVVLVGLSTPFDAGLDEAILAQATVPTVLFQDFWGEQNLILGRSADLILAIDAEAARRNLVRFGAHSSVVGSPRHSAYVGMDMPGIRARMRERIGARHQPVIGFFAQALHRLPGYQRTVEAFVEAVSGMSSSPVVLLRPHPRETAEHRSRTSAMFGGVGFPVVALEGGPVEEALIACDVVCSLFSTCTYDTAYLNRFSSKPVAVPVSMLFDAEIAAYCRQHIDFETFPYHTAGIVRPVYQRDELAGTLSAAIEPSMREEVWRGAHQFLPDPAGAPRLILDRIAEFVRSR